MCSNNMLKTAITSVFRLFVTRFFEPRIFEIRLFETRIFETRLFETRIFETSLFETRIFETRIFEKRLFQTGYGLSKLYHQKSLQLFFRFILGGGGLADFDLPFFYLHARPYLHFLRTSLQWGLRIVMRMTPINFWNQTFLTHFYFWGMPESPIF